MFTLAIVTDQDCLPNYSSLQARKQGKEAGKTLNKVRKELTLVLFSVTVAN